jgi:hypothetical protein
LSVAGSSSHGVSVEGLADTLLGLGWPCLFRVDVVLVGILLPPMLDVCYLSSKNNNVISRINKAN